MSILQSSLRWLKSAFSLPAAEDAPSRTYVSFTRNPGKTEVTSGERLRASEKGKYLSGSLGFIAGMHKRLPRYITPITPMPSTGDPVVDAAYSAAWHKWASNPQLCDFQRRQNFGRLMRTLCKQFLQHGECFSVLDGTSVRIIDPSLVSGKPDKAGDSEDWVDGVRFSAKGQIDGYSLKTKSGAREFVDVSIMMHAIDVERADQPRGVPWLAPGLNGAVDIADLLALEKASAKLHAALAAAVTRSSGAAEEGLTGELQRQLSGAAPDASGHLEEIHGIMVKYLNPDEKVELLASERPSSTFSGFIEFLVRDVAWAGGVPPELVWDASKLNGNNMRFVLGDGQAFFDDIVEALVDGCVRRVYLAVIGAAISAGEVPENENWNAVSFSGPPKITIDVQKDTEADLTRLRNGMMSYPEYYARRNLNATVERKRSIDWFAETIKLCEESGVPIGLFLQGIGGTNNDPNSQDDSSQNDSSSGAKPKQPPAK